MHNLHILLNSHKNFAYFCANYPGSTVIICDRVSSNQWLVVKIDILRVMMSAVEMNKLFCVIHKRKKYTVSFVLFYLNSFCNCRIFDPIPSERSIIDDSSSNHEKYVPLVHNMCMSGQHFYIFGVIRFL